MRFFPARAVSGRRAGIRDFKASVYNRGVAAPSSPARPPGSPPPSEPGRLVDLYIVGGESADANVQLKLATLIASRYRVPAPAVADGLAGGACLVASRLAEGAAHKLADELRDLGAVSKLQTAGVPLRLTTKRTADSRGRPTSDSLSGTFDRVSSVQSAMQLVEVGERIETSVRKASAEAAKKKDAPEIVRCPIHGLNYDRAKASGCIRCLQPAREVARAIEERRSAPGWGGVRTNPVKRALVGLAVSVLVGLAPAAYYARGINGAEVRALRARQAELSVEVGTKAVTDEYDSLDAAVDRTRARGLRRTMVLWLVASAVAGLVWARLSVPREATD